MMEKAIIKAECVDLNHEGLGVVKAEGFPLFVENLLVGEIALIKITKIQKNYGYGRIEKLLSTSPDRVQPICSSYPECGGCQLQHLNYEAQLRFKVKMAEETFKRIGHLDLKVNKILGMDYPYYFRNKVQIPYRRDGVKSICGFFQKNSHEIVPLENCYIQPQEATDIAKAICRLANKYGIAAYDETEKNGCLRHVLIRKTVQDEYMVVLVTKTEDLPHQEELILDLLNEHPLIKSIYQNINERDTNVILGQKNILLNGTPTLVDRLMGLQFFVSPLSFFQTNHEQTEKLYQQVIDYILPQSDDVILDIYCGVGTISLTLAQTVKRVFGIEIVADAVRDAEANAVLNKIENCTFLNGKAEDEIEKLQDLEITKVIVDPPRKGCDQKLLQILIHKNLTRIVYV
ncbi:MAG: 23S rRNA (uracil(1939)-C(5))-methyltransferase RlmD, partial [Acholeplasmataceae bacterium]|nr:23S rRNA (uracil(1939)-C(5))-methyltransferase RlmD [Acholeplasmataceae bacterium]